MENKKNILICPLDWGLGHASRCIPVIKKLVDSNANVIIAADNRPLALLRKEFPGLEFVQFPGYNISYSRKYSMAFKMLLSIPKILKGIYKEHILLKKFINTYKIDAVISDNRYGVWNKKIKCIFITHQIMIKCPNGLRSFEYILYLLNKFFINKYDECWIPDYDGGVNLSGALSHKYPLPSNSYFIEPLSRFYKDDFNEPQKQEMKYDILVILSGPEPQRTIFEEIILNQLKKSSLKAIVIRGVTEEDEEYEISENLKVFSHLETEEMRYYILSSKLVICRSGYSTIMDLVALGKNAVFVPTPGQTEQEYLSEYYFRRIMFLFAIQKDFNLMSVIDKSSFYSGIFFKRNPALLGQRINCVFDKN